MKITKRLLKQKSACEDGIVNVDTWGLIGLNHCEFINGCMDKDRLDYANWLIIRLFKTKKQKTQYAIFAAEQVIEIYENKYPDDDRPRKAIEAAKAYLDRPTSKNKKAAHAAAYAAHASAAAATAAYAYAYAAAAYAAAYASAAATAAYAYAAYASAAYASHATAAANSTIKKKIIKYGLTLIK